MKKISIKNRKNIFITRIMTWKTCQALIEFSCQFLKIPLLLRCAKVPFKNHKYKLLSKASPISFHTPSFVKVSAVFFHKIAMFVKKNFPFVQFPNKSDESKWGKNSFKARNEHFELHLSVIVTFTIELRTRCAGVMLKRKSRGNFFKFRYGKRVNFPSE